MYAAAASRFDQAGSVHFTRQATSPSAARSLLDQPVRHEQRRPTRSVPIPERRCGTECLRKRRRREARRGDDARLLSAGPSNSILVMFDQHTYQYFEDVNWGLLRLWGDRSGRDVLDAGCGFATTSQYIQRRANRVVGVESSGDAVIVARQRIQQVVQADLTKIDDVRDALGARRFDAIIFADVLRS